MSWARRIVCRILADGIVPNSEEGYEGSSHFSAQKVATWLSL